MMDAALGCCVFCFLLSASLALPSVLISCCSHPLKVFPRKLATNSPFSPLQAPSIASVFLYSHSFALLVHQSFKLCLFACVVRFFSSANPQKYLQNNPDRSNELLYFRKTSNKDYNCCMLKSYERQKITDMLPYIMPLFFLLGCICLENAFH